VEFHIHEPLGVTITTSIDNGLKTVTKKYDDGNTQKSTSKVTEEEIRKLQKEAKQYQQQQQLQQQPSYQQKKAQLLAYINSGKLSESQLNEMLKIAGI